MKTRTKISLVAIMLTVLFVVMIPFALQQAKKVVDAQGTVYQLENEKLTTAQRGASYSTFDGVKVAGYKIAPSGYVNNSYINEFLGVTLKFPSADLSKYNAIMFRYANGNVASSLRLSVNQSGKGNISIDVYTKTDAAVSKVGNAGAIKQISANFDGNLICVPANGTASYTSVTSLCLYYNQNQANWSHFTVGDVYFVNFDTTTKTITEQSDVIWSVDFENANYEKQFTQYITKYSYKDAESAGVVRAIKANELYVNSATYYLYNATQNDFVPTTAQTNTFEWYYGASMDSLISEDTYAIKDKVLCFDIKNLGTKSAVITGQVGTNTLQRYDFTFATANYVLVSNSGDVSYGSGIPTGFEGKAYLPVSVMKPMTSSASYGSFASIKLVINNGSSVGANYIFNGITFVNEIPVNATSNVSCGENGQVTLSNPYGVMVDGISTTYTVTANDGYVVDEVTYDGETVELTDGAYVVNYDSSKVFAVTFKEEIVSLGETLVSMNVSAGGKISAIFKYELPLSIQTDENAYVLLSLNGKEKTVLISEAQVENGYYYFEIDVPAAEMTKDITTQLFDGDGGQGSVYTYTVKKWADYIIANGSIEQVELVKAMLNYGAYAQIRFNVNTEVLANEGIFDGANPIESVQTVDANIVESGNANGFEMTSYDLILEAETTIRIYFTASDINNYSIKVSYFDEVNKSFALTPVADGERYYVDIINIAAPLIDREFTVEVVNNVDNSEYSITLSALCYINGVLNSNTTTSAQKDVVKALYIYNQKANEFFGK